MRELDKDALVASIKSSLIQSGKLKEIQARLRSQIYLALGQEAGWSYPPVTETVPGSSPELRAVNWLVCQHLMHNAYWMANSVLSRKGLRFFSLIRLVRARLIEVQSH